MDLLSYTGYTADGLCGAGVLSYTVQNVHGHIVLWGQMTNQQVVLFLTGLEINLPYLLCTFHLRTLS